jgi:hypothetical protein
MLRHLRKTSIRYGLMHHSQAPFLVLYQVARHIFHTFAQGTLPVTAMRGVEPVDCFMWCLLYLCKSEAEVTYQLKISAIVYITAPWASSQKHQSI